MKKLLSVAFAIILVALTATPAFAHGSHHGRRTQAVSYSVCTTESCTQTGLHYHNGNAYAAHYYGDGHAYHGYCDVSNCTLSGYHSHDGAYCFGHTLNDGHNYHH